MSIKELRATAYSIYLECNHGGPAIVMVLTCFEVYQDNTTAKTSTC